MIRAIIFDCDGVIADTEPLHYRAFTHVLADRGITLSLEAYFAKYVGLNDRTFLQAIFRDTRRPLDGQEADRLLAEKNEIYLSMIADGIAPLPGVAELVVRASGRWRLAVCSGARRVEIETILRGAGLTRYFPIIVSADEVAVSKPDPAGFLRTFELLRWQDASEVQAAPARCEGRQGPSSIGNRDPKIALSTAECLVIEDSGHGITAARAAGMRVLAVKSQCSAEQLSLADVVVPDLRSVTDGVISTL